MVDGSESVVGPDRSEHDGEAPANAAGAQNVGARLRTAREGLGLTQRDIAARTRITSRHVEALEAGNYAIMPGRPYALGFARSYARAVGLDEDDIARRVRHELEQRSPRPEPRIVQQFEVGDPSKTPTRLVGWLALMLAIAFVGLGLVFWRSSYFPAGELPALIPQMAAGQDPQPATPAASSAPAPAAAPQGPVVFTALADGIWVKFYDGAGKQLLQKQLAKGESYTVPAEASEPKLWTGRPDALAISIGGREVPRLSQEQKIVKDVPVTPSALLARGGTAGPGDSASSTATM